MKRAYKWNSKKSKWKLIGNYFGGNKKEFLNKNPSNPLCSSDNLKWSCIHKIIWKTKQERTCGNFKKSARFGKKRKNRGSERSISSSFWDTWETCTYCENVHTHNKVYIIKMQQSFTSFPQVFRCANFSGLNPIWLKKQFILLMLSYVFIHIFFFRGPIFI